MRTFIALALLIVIGLRVAAGQPGSPDTPCVDRGTRNPSLLPIDEAPSKPDFLAYRGRLQAAVARRDINAVIEASDRGIRLGFDASGGHEALRKRFTETTESWEELRAVLTLGGSFSSPTGFAAPYVYSRWPEPLDSFECAAVIGRNVRLRAAARLDAAIITPVSYSIVRVLQTTADKQWSPVRLADGRSGYMWHAYLRSPVDYRALFNLVDGRWQMTAFVAGD